LPQTFLPAEWGEGGKGKTSITNLEEDFDKGGKSGFSIPEENNPNFFFFPSALHRKRKSVLLA